MGTARDRLVRAAFDLFAESGFERTTVEQIAARAGTGRTTFFRHFPTKESVVFPDHDAILGPVEARLRAADPPTAPLALHEAARLVLRHYLAEGDLARERYRLTRTVPALRDAEIAGQHRYQRLFRDRVAEWLAAERRPDPLLAEVLANAVVTAHNHVLRAWLREMDQDPEPQLERALRRITDRLWRPETAEPATEVVVLRTDRRLETILPRLEELLQE